MHHWPLDELEGEQVFDIVNNRNAKLINPDWIQKKHLNWNKVHHSEVEGRLISVSNDEDGKIYFI